MYLSYCVFLTVLVNLFADAFFLLGAFSLYMYPSGYRVDKPEPVLFCIKVCPLYCSPRRRRDVDASAIYWEEPPFLSDGYIVEDVPYHFHDPYFFCKPPKKTTTTTTTTMAPTTEEPTWICMVCLKKCNYPKKT